MPPSPDHYLLMVRPDYPAERATDEMRILQSETTKCVGTWIAHFHPECGDDLLDHCEQRHKVSHAA